MTAASKPRIVADARASTDAEIAGGHEPTGAPYDDHYVFESEHGTIRIRSMATGKNPPPFRMMRAQATRNYAEMTLLVLQAKAGKDWPEIEKILEQLDEDEFKAFSEGWSAHSGINPGE